MICNEPPPLDQSDEDDEDSEDFRDFATGLKLDVDPSPMSTPRKGGNSTPSIPVRTENSSSDVSPNKSSVESAVISQTVVAKTVDHSFDASQVNSNHPINSVMKTSYIGTMEENPEPVESEAPDGIEVDSFISMSRSEVVTQPAASSESQMQNSSGSSPSMTDDDDFDDFQDFQTTVTVPVDTVSDTNPIPVSQENGEVIGGCSDVDTSEEVEGVEGMVQEDSEPVSAVELQYEDATSSEPSFETIPVTSTNAAPDIEIFEDAEPLPSVQIPAATVDDKVEFNADFAAFEEDEEDEFDNFQDFKSSGSQQIPESTNNEIETSIGSELKNKLDQTVNGVDRKESLETSSLTKQCIPPTVSETSCLPMVHTISNKPDLPMENSSSSNFNSFSDDDDFEDFQAFQSTPSSLPCSNKVNLAPTAAAIIPPDCPVDFSRGTAKFECLVKSLFVPNSCENSAINVSFSPIDKQLKEQDGNEQWNQVEDFEASQGLLFKWLNSVAYQRFLKSLKIDNSTIVYTDKWGAIEVPRFAASLVDSPLQPETGCKVGSNSMPLSKEVSPVRYMGTEQSSSDHESTNGAVVSSTTTAATVHAAVLIRETYSSMSRK
ncbi:unnamed protein product [Allacma fusca]|uniref:Aftiphilin clathrin-binding box domain-containing protein n=1 Tax=Allacma fusca TaxID=39272 RepID=A0A8J2NKZ9_9HEXA|nr:unnamed protein product [Allacma fusca]